MASRLQAVLNRAATGQDASKQGDSSPSRTPSRTPSRSPSRMLTGKFESKGRTSTLLRMNLNLPEGLAYPERPDFPVAQIKEVPKLGRALRYTIPETAAAPQSLVLSPGDWAKWQLRVDEAINGFGSSRSSTDTAQTTLSSNFKYIKLPPLFWYSCELGRVCGQDFRFATEQLSSLHDHQQKSRKLWDPTSGFLWPKLIKVSTTLASASYVVELISKELLDATPPVPVFQQLLAVREKCFQGSPGYAIPAPSFRWTSRTPEGALASLENSLSVLQAGGMALGSILQLVSISPREDGAAYRTREDDDETDAMAALLRILDYTPKQDEPVSPRSRKKAAAEEAAKTEQEKQADIENKAQEALETERKTLASQLFMLVPCISLAQTELREMVHLVAKERADACAIKAKQEQAMKPVGSKIVSSEAAPPPLDRPAGEAAIAEPTEVREDMGEVQVSESLLDTVDADADPSQPNKDDFMISVNPPRHL
eukprot:TRINITY_DN24784_c0_g1_i2.p1 TRINITY_DN24784_c0_g1~~TRINITY_DN24784_c0_g1_i2.p1  ORF type:complete len:483 (+),score=82.41 TRINITY_DN24784_c0_g1_i2:31-1479(+)